MIYYIGSRDDDGIAFVHVCVDDNFRPLSLHLDKCNHSPTGFEWGYGGSGPAQLALAILADCLPDDLDLAYELHQKFKWRLVANLPKNHWFLDKYEVEQWIFNACEQWQWLPKHVGCAT